MAKAPESRASRRTVHSLVDRWFLLSFFVDVILNKRFGLNDKFHWVWLRGRLQKLKKDASTSDYTPGFLKNVNLWNRRGMYNEAFKTWNRVDGRRMMQNVHKMQNKYYTERVRLIISHLFHKYLEPESALSSILIVPPRVFAQVYGELIERYHFDQCEDMSGESFSQKHLMKLFLQQFPNQYEISHICAELAAGSPITSAITDAEDYVNYLFNVAILHERMVTLGHLREEVVISSFEFVIKKIMATATSLENTSSVMEISIMDDVCLVKKEEQAVPCRDAQYEPRAGGTALDSELMSICPDIVLF